MCVYVLKIDNIAICNIFFDFRFSFVKMNLPELKSQYKKKMRSIDLIKENKTD